MAESIAYLTSSVYVGTGVIQNNGLLAKVLVAYFIVTICCTNNPD